MAFPALPYSFSRFSVALDSSGDDWKIVHLAGEVDGATATDLEQFLDRLDDDVWIDCWDATFINTMGLAVLARASARLSSLRLINVGPNVRRLAELTRMQWLVAEPV